MSQQRQVLAFDIYGTILDTGSVASAIEQHTSVPADQAKQLSLLWRKYQLEYTWRLNSMGLYKPFDMVTQQSLQQAAVESGFDLSIDATRALMDAYNHLETFEDAIPALQALRDQCPDVELMVFSNGTADMITTAVKARLPESFVPMPMFSADWVKIYKPAKAIYESLLTHLELLGQRDSRHGAAPDVWLVSGNPFDVAGARSAGLGAIWIDRAGHGWTDRLLADEESLGPIKIVRGLGEIVNIYKER